MGFYDRILGKKKTPSISRMGDTARDNAKISSEDVPVLVNKGDSLVESSMYAEAIQCYDKALKINPKLTEVWNNKGLALARTGRYAEAIKCYDKAIELKPDDEEVIYNKAMALAQLGNSRMPLNIMINCLK